MIVSRASGAPVIAGAMEFATNLVNHNWKKVAAAEFAAAKKAGLEAILEEIAAAGKKDTSANEAVTAPPKEICTG